jgi:co-chaperonin GroES (HSP10)
MTIEARGHHILVKVDRMEKKTESGIVIPDTVRDADKRAAEIATVVNIGETAYMNDGLGNKPWVKVGDRIFFAKYSGKWAIDPKDPDPDPDLLFIRDDDVIGAIV